MLVDCITLALALAQPAEAPPPPEPPRPPLRGSLADGFGIDTADGQHGVSVNILASLAYELQQLDDHVEQGFRLVYMRPTLKAHLRGKMFRFAFQPAFDGPSPRLILAFGRVELHEAFAIRAGVYRPYYARGFIVGLEPQLLPDRGPVISEFASGNDLGVTVMGKPLGLITDSQTPQLGEKPLPFRFGIGVNGYTDEVRESRTTTDPITTDAQTSTVDRRDVGGGGEVAMHWRRLSGQAAYTCDLRAATGTCNSHLGVLQAQFTL